LLAKIIFELCEDYRDDPNRLGSAAVQRISQTFTALSNCQRGSARAAKDTRSP
jgi:hypothetical protein